MHLSCQAVSVFGIEESAVNSYCSENPALVSTKCYDLFVCLIRYIDGVTLAKTEPAQFSVVRKRDSLLSIPQLFALVLALSNKL